MRTQILQSLFLVLFLSNFLVGQDCFTDNIPNGGNCASAQFLCGSLFDGYMGTLQEPSGEVPEDPLCDSSGDIDNIQWFSFFPCEDSISITIDPLMCDPTALNLYGLQAGVFEDCVLDNSLFCGGGFGLDAIEVNLGNLEPGNIYYLFLDGYAGSVCDFELTVNYGIDTSTPIQPDPVVVPIEITDSVVVCEGKTVEACFDVPNLNIGNFSCGEITTEDLDYVACFSWQVTGTPEDSSIDIADAFDIIPSENSVCCEVVFYEEGVYEITASAVFNPSVFEGPGSCTIADVDFVPVEVEVENHVLQVEPPIFTCEGEVVIYCDSSYNESVVVECERNCTTFVQQFIFEPLEYIDLGQMYICDNECFEWQGIQYCESGTYDEVDTMTCEKRYVFSLINLDASITDDEIHELNCLHSFVVLNPIYAFNNASELMYTWYDESNTPIGNEPTLSVNSMGDYTVEVTADDFLEDCIVSQTFTVTENNNPPTLQIIEPFITCDDAIGTISVTSDMNLTANTWTGPNTFLSDKLSPDVVEAGQYILTAIGENGCVTVDTVEVLSDIVKPNVTPIYSDLNCYTEEVNLSYEADREIRSQLWESAGFSSDQASVLTSTAGMYTLVVTALNGCTATESFTVNDNKTYPVIDAGEDKIWNCNTESIDISAIIPNGNQYEVEWNQLMGTPFTLVDDNNIIANSEGTYELVVSDNDSGCVSKDTVHIVENEDVPNSFVGELADPLCFNTDNGYIWLESVVGGTGPYSLSINDIEIEENAVLDNLSDGTYNLQIVDSNGCEYSEPLVLVRPTEIVLDVPTELEIKYNVTGYLELEHSLNDMDVAEINWYNATGDKIGKGSSIEVNEAVNTTYTVELITTDGCNVSQQIVIRVDSTIDVYIPNVFSPNGDGSNDKFWIFSSDEDIMIESLIIYDRWGNLVYQAKDMPVGESSNGWDGTFNGVSLNPDVYVYIAKIRTSREELYVKSGDVTLVR